MYTYMAQLTLEGTYPAYVYIYVYIYAITNHTKGLNMLYSTIF